MSETSLRVASNMGRQAHASDFAGQLHEAAVCGDERRITRLVSELLRCKGLSRSQRIAMQQRALLSLVRSLRCAALNDDHTGLLNRRGFVQTGTRLLDLAARDGRRTTLVYISADQVERVGETLGEPAARMLVHDCGNLLRDVFPSYGVYEVVGRVGHDEFAALTMRAEFATCESARRLLREALPDRSARFALSVGVAHADAATASGIDELLEAAKRNANRPAGELGVELPISRLGVTALAAYRV